MRSARVSLSPIVQLGSVPSGSAMKALAASAADTVIFPLQDVLGLDSNHRLNLPKSA